jgi:hypothetical protein
MGLRRCFWRELTRDCSAVIPKVMFGLDVEMEYMFGIRTGSVSHILLSTVCRKASLRAVVGKSILGSTGEFVLGGTVLTFGKYWAKSSLARPATTLLSRQAKSALGR